MILKENPDLQSMIWTGKKCFSLDRLDHDHFLLYDLQETSKMIPYRFRSRGIMVSGVITGFGIHCLVNANRTLRTLGYVIA